MPREMFVLTHPPAILLGDTPNTPITLSYDKVIWLIACYKPTQTLSSPFYNNLITIFRATRESERVESDRLSV